eukprot:363767-Chlamydomonas_euryale.AAC.7
MLYGAWCTRVSYSKAVDWVGVFRITSIDVRGKKLPSSPKPAAKSRSSPAKLDDAREPTPPTRTSPCMSPPKAEGETTGRERLTGGAELIGQRVKVWWCGGAGAVAWRLGDES